MHRIIAAHLNSFSKSHGIEIESESDRFEKFCNFCIIESKSSAEFDLDDVTTGPGDDGIDGIAVLIDEEVVISKEDCQRIFTGGKKNHDVEIVFVQAKTSESFGLGDFLKFKESILRLVSSDSYNVADSVQMAARETFDIILENVPKIRDGKPSMSARFITTGIYQSPDAFETAKRDAITQFSELGIFNNIDIKFIDREELTKIWVSTYSGTSTNIEMFSHAALPAIDGIEEAYLGVVKAKDFVEKLLLSEDGSIQSQVFEENVRSFLGGDNPVNSSIASTLSATASASRFPVLNNGITIVSPNVIIQGTTLHLENYQIVNGCQTSHVLWENYRSLNDSTMVNIKVIETINEDIFAELVRATNSQTKVDDTQFFSLRPIIKRVEKYFDSFEEGDGRLYFERRDRQFVGREIPATRIFNLHTAARCVCAMFIQRPDLSFKYPKQMYQDLGETIFADEIKEIVFYTACLTLYRIHLLASNGTIPQNAKKFKWHIMPLIRSIICEGKDIYPVNSNKAEKQCEKIIEVIGHHSKASTDIINKAIKAVFSIQGLTDDRLKRQALTQELMGLI